jgi:hypothetical protein
MTWPGALNMDNYRIIILVRGFTNYVKNWDTWKFSWETEFSRLKEEPKRTFRKLLQYCLAQEICRKKFQCIWCNILACGSFPAYGSSQVCFQLYDSIYPTSTPLLNFTLWIPNLTLLLPTPVSSGNASYKIPDLFRVNYNWHNELLFLAAIAALYVTMSVCRSVCHQRVSKLVILLQENRKMHRIHTMHGIHCIECDA